MYSFMKPSDRQGPSGAGRAPPGLAWPRLPTAPRRPPFTLSHGAGAFSHDGEQSPPEQKGVLLFPPGVIAQGSGPRFGLLGHGLA